MRWRGTLLFGSIICGAVAAALIWNKAPATTAGSAGSIASPSACTAVAIDRGTGITTQAPCDASRMLLAVHADPN